MICSEVVDIGLLQCPSCEKKLSEHMMHIKYVLECSFWVDSGHSQVFFLEIFFAKSVKEKRRGYYIDRRVGQFQTRYTPYQLYLYVGSLYTLVLNLN